MGITGFAHACSLRLHSNFYTWCYDDNDNSDVVEAPLLII